MGRPTSHPAEPRSAAVVEHRAHVGRAQPQGREHRRMPQHPFGQATVVVEPGGDARGQASWVMVMAAGPLVEVTPSGVRHCVGVPLTSAAVMTAAAPANLPAVTVPW